MHHPLCPSLPLLICEAGIVICSEELNVKGLLLFYNNGNRRTIDNLILGFNGSSFFNSNSNFKQKLWRICFPQCEIQGFITEKEG